MLRLIIFPFLIIFCFVLSVANCKERWRNLRACLTRHLKQQKHANHGGPYHKPYYLAKHMKFLLPHTRSRSGKDDIDGDDDSSDATEIQVFSAPTKPAETSTTHSENVQPAKQEKSVSFSDANTTTYTISTATDDAQYVTFMQNASDDHLQIDNVSIEAKNIETPFASSSNSKSIETFEPDPKRLRSYQQESDDADLNFFRSLLPDVRSMTPSQKRRFKIGILSLVDNVLTNSDANS